MSEFRYSINDGAFIFELGEQNLATYDTGSVFKIDTEIMNHVNKEIVDFSILESNKVILGEAKVISDAPAYMAFFATLSKLNNRFDSAKVIRQFTDQKMKFSDLISDYETKLDYAFYNSYKSFISFGFADSKVSVTELPSVILKLRGYKDYNLNVEIFNNGSSLKYAFSLYLKNELIQSNIGSLDSVVDEISQAIHSDKKKSNFPQFDINNDSRTIERI